MLTNLQRLKNLFRSAADTRERRQRPRIAARAGTRVLVVDDSPTVLAMMRIFLAQNGFDVFEARDAERGLVLAREERPELVFLDIVMPGMNGFAALRALRHDVQTQHTPVIMMSGNSQATEAYYAQRIGADAFLGKPFGREDVFACIERLLDAERTPRRRAGPLRATA